MKRNILTIIVLILSLPTTTQLVADPLMKQTTSNQVALRTEPPVLLFDSSVLKEEREGQRVFSYSQSTELSEIRKSRICLAEKYKAEQKLLEQELSLANQEKGQGKKGLTYDQNCAIYLLKKSAIEVKVQESLENYHAAKKAYNTQEKNVYKKIKIIIDKIAKRLATSEVVTYDSDTIPTSPYLTYAGHPTIDITAEILETLNKEYANRSSLFSY